MKIVPIAVLGISFDYADPITIVGTNSDLTLHGARTIVKIADTARELAKCAGPSKTLPLSGCRVTVSAWSDNTDPYANASGFIIEPFGTVTDKAHNAAIYVFDCINKVFPPNTGNYAAKGLVSIGREKIVYENARYPIGE